MNGELETIGQLYGKSSVPLNDKQKAFLNHFIFEGKGHSVLQGLGGSGKSTVMSLLKDWYGDKIVFLGSTGVASQNLPNNIGIGTAHSYLSLARKPANELNYKKVGTKCSNLLGKSDLVEIIVIDEGFFLNSDSLDLIWRRLERFNKKTRNRKKRDIRLLLVGDTGQAVTITDKETRTTLKDRWGVHLMFDSTVWERFDFDYYVFDRVERQSDKTYKACLDVIRYNQTHRFAKCLEWLNKRVNRKYDRSQMVLAATNKTVDRINGEVLEANPNVKIHFPAVVKGKFDMKDTLVRKEGITLCVDLKVMTINNDMEGRWINGSTGVTTAVDTEGAYVLFDHSGDEHYVPVHTWENKEIYTDYEKDEDGVEHPVLKEKFAGTLSCISLLQSSAITISKAQGLTIRENFVIDMEKDWLYTWDKLEDFGTNFLYIALSRGVDINKITLARPITRKHIKCCERSIRFWFKCCEESLI